MADAFESPLLKRRRMEDEDGTSSEQTYDQKDWQRMRELKQSFDGNFQAVDQMLNSLTDKKTAIEIWSKMSVMSSDFSQLMRQTVSSTGLQLGQDLAVSQEMENLKRQLNDSHRTIAELRDANNELQVQLKQREEENQTLQRKLSPSEFLPIECLQQIISYCSIRDVHRGCMKVSKKWNDASHSDLKTRASVTILARGSPEARGGNVICFPKLRRIEKTITCLKRMTGVTHLVLKFLTCCETKLFLPLLKSWSPNHLTHDGIHFPEGLSFPRLTSLTTSGGNLLRSSRRLPLQQMERLDVDVWPLEKLINLVTGMKNLTIMRLSFSTWSSCPKKMDALVQLFSSFQKLIRFEFKYTCPVDGSIEASDVDTAVTALVKQNPQLQVISLTHMPVTDQSLVSLARLTHLTSVSITADELAVTAEAIVIILMKEGCQHSLKSLTLSGVPALDGKSHETINELADKTDIKCHISGLIRG